MGQTNKRRDNTKVAVNELIDRAYFLLDYKDALDKGLSQRESWASRE